MQEHSLLNKYMPLIGESIWHSKTVDPTIDEISKLHFDRIEKILKKYYDSPKGLKILEIASYTHWTGYKLASDYDVKMYLFDISASTLELGKKYSKEKGYDKCDVKRYVGDFHSLPFDNESFDLVYICSALHHTWNYKKVISEMYRVTKSNGLVFYENEPTEREFCFYNFRTNRLHDFTNFEKKCYDTGVLRILSEPFFGSRPEFLFGMIENQNINLSDFLAENDIYADYLEFLMYPETCMSQVEIEIVKDSGRGEFEIEKALREKIFSKFEGLFDHYSDVDRAIGIKIPTKKDLESMLKNITKRIVSLPTDTNSLEYKIELSKIFGSPITFLAKKKTNKNINNFKNDDIEIIEKGDIVYAFSKEISRFLFHTNSLIPDFNIKNENQLLDNIFIPTYWNVHHNINDERILFYPKKTNFKIKVPKIKENKGLLVIRLNVAQNKFPYKIKIEVKKNILFEYEVYKADSFLISSYIDKLSEEVSISINCNDEFSGDKININYFGLFNI